jgi:hypothetical protein
MCPDKAVNDLERDGARRLMNGAEASFDGGVLMLSRDSYSLAYRLDK